MKENIKRIFSIMAFILAVLLPIVSHPNNGEKFYVFTLILIVFGGLITSLTISVWSKQNRKKCFIRTLPTSFGLNSIIFIMGYLFTSLQPIILK
jgi:VIT1/CCC1 family predicted Fe2+/Mn2+ transporter